MVLFAVKTENVSCDYGAARNFEMWRKDLGDESVTKETGATKKLCPGLKSSSSRLEPVVPFIQ
jgi:hypothetical protein